MTHEEIDRQAQIVLGYARGTTGLEKMFAKACLQLLGEGRELAEVVKETREFLKGWRAVSPNHIGLISRVEAAIAKWTEKEDVK